MKRLCFALPTLLALSMIAVSPARSQVQPSGLMEEVQQSETSSDPSSDERDGFCDETASPEVVEYAENEYPAFE